jgi:hypothetical protein
MAWCFNTARECLTVTIEAFNTLLSLRVSEHPELLSLTTMAAAMEFKAALCETVVTNAGRFEDPVDISKTPEH